VFKPDLYYFRYRSLCSNLICIISGIDDCVLNLICIISGIDELLSKHIAHLFIRDPISLFSEKIHQNDEEDTDHFEVKSI